MPTSPSTQFPSLFVPRPAFNAVDVQFALYGRIRFDVLKGGEGAITLHAAEERGLMRSAATPA